MTNEPSWLRTYIGDLAREAGLTEPTETDPGLYGVAGPACIETLGRIFVPVDPSKLEPPALRIDEMTLADYRRGIANMKTRYV